MSERGEAAQLDQIKAMPKRHEFFVGIDSDGCAFDTMEVKHKECFIPNIIEFYRLAAVARVARECAEFVNLYSKHRGINRFPALALTFDLLAQRPEVKRRGFEVPAITGLRSWTALESKLGNPALEEAVQRTGDPDLTLALAWSKAVNQAVDRIVQGVPPFPLVRETLEVLADKADVAVVSATPTAALRKEWGEHGLAERVGLIAGQEVGSKREILAAATSGKYEPQRMLMIGDAPGDLKAAQAVGALFYPINPGGEDDSWARFFQEDLPRFLDGGYAGAVMEARVAEFRALLPETPPWGD
ncbi:Haloacid dehalogenase domain protein hydrolase [Isosphaera pallida ATCC 43644]|uniref:Haloacid dehalogenase domain protein hydrolase n=1 Tax=Isosphaera pallida (strain ATCC 43644 / DSM 9630 / IS1B) TaxID=575540 RepID=E8R4H8_ISOPI|nr:HAD hydrolase-like protein [Isosphaera pallida]ADV63773.1 Haloacid dehalogenase domain protein hydrolase [Isosphaera pallida ATCC 43644]